MEPSKQSFRSYSCPASLDLITSMEALNQVVRSIEESPGCFLSPILPYFQAEIAEKKIKLDEKQKACLALQSAFQKVPFLLKLATIPGIFLNTQDFQIKNLGLGVIHGDPTVPPLVLDAVIQQIERAMEGEENIWVDVVDWFIDELEAGRESKIKKLKKVENPVSCYLATSFLKLKALMTNQFLSSTVDAIFENYKTVADWAKFLLMKNINRFLAAVVEKVHGRGKLRSERKIFADMIYVVVNQFLLESKHLLFYRECTTHLINKVHGEDVSREVLKETFLKALWCIIDDIRQNDKFIKGAAVGVTKVKEIR